MFAFQPDAASRFKVDSGFKGADGAGASSSGGKPVQFEREKESDKEDVSCRDGGLSRDVGWR
jgi:hypothetical protein